MQIANKPHQTQKTKPTQSVQPTRPAQPDQTRTQAQTSPPADPPQDRVEISQPDEPEPEANHPFMSALRENYGPTGQKEEDGSVQQLGLGPNSTRPGQQDKAGGKALGDQPTLEEIAEEKRNQQIDEALRSGQPTTLINGAGQDVQVQASLTEGDENHDAYDVKINGRDVRVEVPKGEDPNTYLSRVSDYYSQQPENLQGATNRVTFEAGGDPEGKAAAEASNGQITFYSGDDNLDKHTFDHEFAHNVGDIVEDRQAGYGERFRETVKGHEVDDDWNAYIPNGYNDAIETDDRQVSDYGDTNGAEDFAEFYADFMQAQAKGPEALEKFEQKYPNRSEVLNDIIENQPDLTPSTR